MGTGAQAVWRYSVDCVHNFGASRDVVGAFCRVFFTNELIFLLYHVLIAYVLVRLMLF